MAVGPQIKRGIILKSPREIELMREAGALVAEVLSKVRAKVAPGVNSADLNAEAERIIERAGAVALFKGVQAPKARYPFPAALCTSVNEEVVHGLPNQRPLAAGDIISVDCGVRLRGYCGDAATTIALVPVAARVRRLMEVTAGMLNMAIEFMVPGRRWSEVARKMQRFAEDSGFSVVREFVGHGIGQQMHEDPKVPNYYDRQQAKHDFVLRPGMVLAVEPMVTMGTAEVEYRDHDYWVVVTRDRQWAAHFEHTIAVTDQGCDVLTAAPQ